MIRRSTRPHAFTSTPRCDAPHTKCVMRGPERQSPHQHLWCGGQSTRWGFTLTEVLVVVVILVVLAVIALPRYFRIVRHARATEAVANLSAIRTGELLYQATHGTFTEAIDLPSINAELELELHARHFDYEVEQAEQSKFLIVAMSRPDGFGATTPLRVTMDHTGKLTFSDTGGGGSGGSGGGGSSGSGSLGGGGGSASTSSGDGSSGGSGGSGGGDGGGSSGGGDGDGGSGGGGGGGSLNGFMQDIFGVLSNDGQLAKTLAQFITNNNIKLVFEPLPTAADCTSSIGGTVGPSNSWWIPQPGTSQIVLNQLLATKCGWTATEMATIMAHEAEHERQVFANLFLDTNNPSVLWLEDVEGPAYVTETLVWNSLRRDAQGKIVLTMAKGDDIDFRANTFILPDGTVDVAAHNSYISQSRGIKPNCPFFFQSSCS